MRLALLRKRYASVLGKAEINSTPVMLFRTEGAGTVYDVNGT